MSDEAAEKVALEEPMMDFANIGKTVDGTGFAYRTMSCVSKGVGSIWAMESYVHLQNVDLSGNAIEDVSHLKGLTFLLRLNLSRNAVASIECWGSDDPFPYLVDLDMSGNSLPSLPPLPMKALKTASFAQNSITSCEDFAGHDRLRSLDLSEQRDGNKITCLSGIGSLPNLTSLNASSNELQDLNGLSALPALKRLNLAANKFQDLEGPWDELPEVEALDLSSCQLPVPKPLEALQQLRKLAALEVKENPFSEMEGNVRVEVLICRPGLGSIDGEPVTEEEAEEARTTAEQREEEARQKAAEAAAGGEEGAEDEG